MGSRRMYVQQIQTTKGAFTAIFQDFSAVTGGDADSMRYQLYFVQQLPTTIAAFAAILAGMALS